jgi:hydrogenase nickel incorporation protein HypA/HybF
MEFGEERLNSLERIFLKVGILSNIEPRLLMNAFEAFQQTYPTFSKVSLEIESTPLVIHCSSCDVDSEVQNYKFICKSCGAPSKRLFKAKKC